MIQLKRTDKGFELKNQTKKLSIEGTTVILGDQSIDQAGEYEVDGIEVIYGAQAALIIWDQLQIVAVFVPEKPATFEKAQFSPCDVVVLNLSQSADKTQINDILETYDPKLVIAAPAAKELLSNVGSNIQETEVYKLSAQTLPEEGRDFIVVS